MMPRPWRSSRSAVGLRAALGQMANATVSCFDLGRSLKGLVEVPYDVVDILDAHGDPHEIRTDVCSEQGLVGQLLMGGRGGVDDERARVSDVGQVAGELERLDECSTSVAAAFDAEREHGTGSLGKVASGPIVVRRVGEAGVPD